VLAADAMEERDAAVVRAAAAIARRSGARLTVLHAAPPPHLEPGVPPLGMGLDLVTPLVERARERLRARAEELALPGAAVLRVEPGIPATVIARVADEIEPDLLVIGATTLGGPLGKLLGSTAERIAQAGHRPVLVVRGELRLPLRRILAPVDLGVASDEALHAGLALLTPLVGTDGADVDLLFVLNSRPDPQFSQRQLEQLAESELQKLIASFPAAERTRLNPLVLAGEEPYTDTMLGCLRALPPDLVLLGSRSGGALRRLRAGVAAELLRQAPTSVLVLPRQPSAEDSGELADDVEEVASPT
jgi:nucleotide-binding universal stress UspA family protein